MRTHKRAIILALAVLAAATTAAARALATHEAASVIPLGGTVSFTGNAWTCINHTGYLTCQHGGDRPYLDLAGRSTSTLVVTVHPASGPARAVQSGDPNPVFVFVSQSR